MKECPQCQRVEPADALTYCRADGTPLVNDTRSGTQTAGNEAATRAFPPTKGIQETREDVVRDTARTTLLAHETPTVKPNHRKLLVLVVAGGIP